MKELVRLAGVLALYVSSLFAPIIALALMFKGQS
jgi:hypothetical protein